MRITVHLFARARDIAGASRVHIELVEGAKVADLREHVGALYPGLAGLLEHCAVAVDDEFADNGTPLSPNAEVALLPPVSGG